jgi:hypothetical protein
MFSDFKKFLKIVSVPDFHQKNLASLDIKDFKWDIPQSKRAVPFKSAQMASLV